MICPYDYDTDNGGCGGAALRRVVSPARRATSQLDRSAVLIERETARMFKTNRDRIPLPPAGFLRRLLDSPCCGRTVSRRCCLMLRGRYCPAGEQQPVASRAVVSRRSTPVLTPRLRFGKDDCPGSLRLPQTRNPSVIAATLIVAAVSRLVNPSPMVGRRKKTRTRNHPFAGKRNDGGPC